MTVTRESDRFRSNFIFSRVRLCLCKRSRAYSGTSHAINLFTAMDVTTVDQFPKDLPWLEICIFFGSVILVISVFNRVVLSPDEECPITFRVPVPEQCDPKWKGEVLEETSIKVGECVLPNMLPLNGLLHQYDKHAHIRNRSPAPAPFNATIQPMAAC